MLDFTYQANNWGVGLPPAGDNASNWPIMRPLLANPALRPAPSNIRDAVVSFREALAIRKSSKLFRLARPQTSTRGYGYTTRARTSSAA